MDSGWLADVAVSMPFIPILMKNSPETMISDHPWLIVEPIFVKWASLPLLADYRTQSRKDLPRPPLPA